MCADPDERHAFEIRPACGCVPCKCAILRGHEHEGLTHQHLDIEIPAVSGDQREFDLSSIDELGDFRDPNCRRAELPLPDAGSGSASALSAGGRAAMVGKQPIPRIS
jgi:hypothetical protein